MSSQVERITAVETRLQSLESTVGSMDKKLDDLLALKYKGAGAFWLASTIIGTGIIALLTQFLHYVGIK
jgi:hypothetical protein